MTDPYSTHLPILKKFRPRRVLEFGPGVHSTGFWLSRRNLECLVSVERNDEWRERIAKEFSDKRWDLVEEAPDPADFDLVLIDDGQSAAERVQTIRWVLSREHPRVVIHDAEVPEYRDVYGGHDHVLYDDKTPHTAVVAAT